MIVHCADIAILHTVCVLCWYTARRTFERVPLQENMSSPSVILLPHRRQQWLGTARDHSARLAQACAHVVQFEISRQGAAWAPGSPLVTEAFANCSLLLQQVRGCGSLQALNA